MAGAGRLSGAGPGRAVGAAGDSDAARDADDPGNGNGGDGDALAGPPGGLRLEAACEVAAPAGFVFAAARAFRAHERRARAAGAQLHRAEAPEGVRIRWRVAAPLRGRLRRFTLDLVSERPGRRMDFAFAGRRLEGASRLTVEPLPQDRCRLVLQLVVRARTRAARLALSGLRLARGRLERRLQAGLAARARLLEARWAAERDGSEKGQVAGGQGAARDGAGERGKGS